MWVETGNGELVNLDKFKRIKVMNLQEGRVALAAYAPDTSIPQELYAGEKMSVDLYRSGLLDALREGLTLYRKPLLP